MCDVDKIRELAIIFRTAIEAKKDHLSRIAPKFEYFPRNCCGVAANLLAKYLSLNGCGDFNIESGERESGELHHWLRQGSLIVDITADQFPDRTERVIVTTDDKWHKMFSNEPESHVADFERNAQGSGTYSRMLEIIREHVSRG